MHNLVVCVGNKSIECELFVNMCIVQLIVIENALFQQGVYQFYAHCS